MNCPNCGAAMRLGDGKDYFDCGFCFTVHVPDPDDEGIRVLGVAEAADAAPCPICRAPLHHASLANRRFLFCTACHGVLIRIGQFLELVRELRSSDAGPVVDVHPRDPSDLDRPLTCPRCRRRMDTHLYAGPGNITIDNCPDCSLNWLDYGELRHIVRARDESPDPRAWEVPG